MWSLATFPHRLLYDMGTVLGLGFSQYYTLYGYLYGCKSLFREIQSIVLSQQKKNEVRNNSLTLPSEN